MLKYIENLKNEYLNTQDEKERFEIKNKLRKEKESAKKIISEYLGREARVGTKCMEVCEHEEEIIQKISEILDQLKD